MRNKTESPKSNKNRKKSSTQTNRLSRKIMSRGVKRPVKT